MDSKLCSRVSWRGGFQDLQTEESSDGSKMNAVFQDTIIGYRRAPLIEFSQPKITFISRPHQGKHYQAYSELLITTRFFEEGPKPGESSSL